MRAPAPIEAVAAAQLATLPCTCGSNIDAGGACPTCRAWAVVRAAVERAASAARRTGFKRQHGERIERRVRRIEDALIAAGLLE